MVKLSADAYPIELDALDISAYRNGNTGVDHATTFDSGRPGPHVLVSAVVHGNELCGAHAVDFLHRSDIRPSAGRLTLAFMNVAAYASFDPALPLTSRFVDDDFNRVWSPEALDGPGDSTALRRARAVRKIVESADILLDIHSMQHGNAPLAMAGPLAKGKELARRVGTPRIVVTDHGHSAGRRMRDYGRFASPSAPQNALLVECGQHWQAASRTVAIETMLRFLATVGSIERDGLAAHLPQQPLPEQRFIEVTHPVTIRTHEFEFTQDYEGMEIIPKAGTVVAVDGGEPIRTPYDNCVLVMPSSRYNAGQTAVRLGRYIDTR